MNFLFIVHSAATALTEALELQSRIAVVAKISEVTFGGMVTISPSTLLSSIGDLT